MNWTKCITNYNCKRKIDNLQTKKYNPCSKISSRNLKPKFNKKKDQENRLITLYYCCLSRPVLKLRRYLIDRVYKYY